MTLYKPVKSDEQTIEIKTETGHIIKFKLIPRVFVDFDKNDNGNPFFFVEFPAEYLGTFKDKKPMSIKKIAKLIKDREIDNYWKAREFDVS